MKVNCIILLNLFLAYPITCLALGRPEDGGINSQLLEASDALLVGNFAKPPSSPPSDYQNTKRFNITFGIEQWLTIDKAINHPHPLSVILDLQSNVSVEMLDRIGSTWNGIKCAILVSVSGDTVSLIQDSNNVFLLLDMPQTIDNYTDMESFFVSGSIENLAKLATIDANYAAPHVLEDVFVQSCQTLINLSALSSKQWSVLQQIGTNLPYLRTQSLRFRLLSNDKSAMSEAISAAASANETDKNILGTAFSGLLGRSDVSISDADLKASWTAFGEKTKSSILDNIPNTRAGLSILKMALSDPDSIVQYLAVSRAFDNFPNDFNVKKPSVAKFMANKTPYLEVATKTLNNRNP